MINRQILVDTGPLVAILSPTDNYHQICVETLKEIRPPLLTCWSVLTEVHWLIKNNKLAIASLFNMIKGGLLKVIDLPNEASVWLNNFLLKYHDMGVQIADASLCYLAEIHKIEIIFTLDRKDFSIYRIKNNKTLKIIPNF
jgi:uncharacterized protein